jgi:hypothetical protein
MDIKFSIIKKHGSYIVRRTDGEYNQHAHINKYSTCKLLIKLIHTNKLPTSEYLQGSCRRLLTDEEYARLKSKKKQKYVNKGGCL